MSSSCTQIAALHWKYISMFVTVLSVPTNHEHRTCTIWKHVTVKPAISPKCDVSSWPVLLVNVGLLDSLVLSTSVLEPYLDLGLCQRQRLRQLEPSAPRDVLAPLILQLQPQRLFIAKRRPLPPRPPLFPPTSGHCKNNSYCDIRPSAICMQRRLVIRYRRFGTTCRSPNFRSQLPVYAEPV